MPKKKNSKESPARLKGAVPKGRDTNFGRDLISAATEILAHRRRGEVKPEMGITAIDPVAYGKLLAAELPKAIENDEEFERMAARLEELDFPDRALTAEEKALRAVLVVLIRDYDDKHYPLPDVPPHEVVQFLMEQRGLKQADLVELLGTRAQVSDLVKGRRAISKAQAKKLAEFFHVSVELFI